MAARPWSARPARSSSQPSPPTIHHHQRPRPTPSPTRLLPPRRSQAGTYTDYNLPFDAPGSRSLRTHRNTVRSAAYGAQASAADLENTRLTLQAELASDYFQLRGQDELTKLLDATVIALQKSLDLTRPSTTPASAPTKPSPRLKPCWPPPGAGDQSRNPACPTGTCHRHVDRPARFQLLPCRRALFLHSAADSAGLPSELLERRPDIAAATPRRPGQLTNRHRQGCLLSILTLSASGGFDSTSISNWFTWPAAFSPSVPPRRRLSSTRACAALPSSSSRRSTTPPSPTIVNPSSLPSSRWKTISLHCVSSQRA